MTHHADPGARCHVVAWRLLARLQRQTQGLRKLGIGATESEAAAHLLYYSPFIRLTKLSAE